MNREILFRGKRIDNGEWVHGYLIGDDVIAGEIIEFEDEYFYCEFWWKVDPKTVGQFTGLHDKNGVKIFEGDIARLCRDIFKEKGNYVGIIKWDKNGFGFDTFKWIGSHSEDKTKWPMLSQFIVYPYVECYEIIGNIHDNPDLLKGEL